MEKKIIKTEIIGRIYKDLWRLRVGDLHALEHKVSQLAHPTITGEQIKRLGASIVVKKSTLVVVTRTLLHKEGCRLSHAHYNDQGTLIAHDKDTLIPLLKRIADVLEIPYERIHIALPDFFSDCLGNNIFFEEAGIRYLLSFESREKEPDRITLKDLLTDSHRFRITGIYLPTGLRIHGVLSHARDSASFCLVVPD